MAGVQHAGGARMAGAAALPYAAAMLSRMKFFAFLALAVLAAVGAYDSRESVLSSFSFALACAVCLVMALREKAGKRKADVLHDPALSTLVFPPESKFEESAFRKG
ncbi:hypothetical protein WG922_20235 [Ramlibacter sp. AN1015]|uniref:hypothetical protein n=1 Tax=Ramlibacter sp. AN1015 TaxID=3133428 RepID=UPI0030C15B92